MRKILTCVHCGEPLSRSVAIQSGKDPKVTNPVLRDRQPPTPSGIAHKSYEPIQRSFGDEPAKLEFVPQVWMNPADILEIVRHSHKGERLSGCCGIAGSDGPNQICQCGSEIGTRQNDCMTANIFIPEPEATAWVDVE